MPRINLLPWREELRTRRKNQFFMGLGGAVVGAGLVALIAQLILGGIISNQRERNGILSAEIKALDARIEEILDLETKKDRLLARMEIIEQLQGSRPEIVHIFDEMARALPDGVRLTSIKQTGKRIEIRGTAESNTRVSAFMRNIDRSEWLTRPDLEVVEVREAGSKAKRGEPQPAGEFVGRTSQFVVYADQVSTAASDGEAAQ